MRLRLLVLLALLPAVCSPQATTNEIYLYAAVVGQAAFQMQTVRLDSTLTLTPDAAGVLHLGVAAPLPGAGMIVISSAGTPPQLTADTAFLAYRTMPPTGPGPCVQVLAPTMPEGTGAWAAGDGYFYTCVPDPAQPGSFVWARAALQTTW